MRIRLRSAEAVALYRKKEKTHPKNHPNCERRDRRHKIRRTTARKAGSGGEVPSRVERGPAEAVPRSPRGKEARRPEGLLPRMGDPPSRPATMHLRKTHRVKTHRVKTHRHKTLVRLQRAAMRRQLSRHVPAR